MKVIAQQWVSVDGYADGLDGVMTLFGAVPPENDALTKQYNQKLLTGVAELLFGRNTYEQFVQYWPTATEVVAEQINRMPKVVFSKSRSNAPWPNQPDAQIEKDAVAYVRERRAENTKGDLLMWGSLAVMHDLLAAGELDELDLFVSPVALGKGTPLLAEPQALELLETSRWDSLIHTRYRVLR